MIVITLAAGSFSANAFCNAFTRESSSRWSMMTGRGVAREGELLTRPVGRAGEGQAGRPANEVLVKRTKDLDMVDIPAVEN